MSASCEGGSGTTRPDIPEIVSEYVTADRLETSAALPVSQEIVTGSNPNYTTPPNPLPIILQICLILQTIPNRLERFKNASILPVKSFDKKQPRDSYS